MRDEGSQFSAAEVAYDVTFHFDERSPARSRAAHYRVPRSSRVSPSARIINERARYSVFRSNYRRPRALIALHGHLRRNARGEARKSTAINRALFGKLPENARG